MMNEYPKNNHELRGFVVRFFLTTLRYMALGALLGAVVGVGMAALASAVSERNATTMEHFVAIVANYSLFGTLSGGIIGIVTGLLTQTR